MPVQNGDTQVKRLNDNRIGGYLALWGSPEERDLEGQYFTRQTNFWSKDYPNPPVLFDHASSTLPGMESATAEDVRFGTIKSFKPDDMGLWIEATIDEHNEWVQAVLKLIDEGVLHWSSGSVPHMVNIDKNGYIKGWPIVEGSTTHIPAEPRGTDVVRLKHYVNQQAKTEGQPEIAPAGAVAPSGTPDVESNVSVVTEGHTMTLQMDAMTVKAVIEAYATTHAADLQAAVSGAVKQGGGGMIAETLRPLASELAGFAGTDEETALGILVAFVAEHAMPAGETEEPLPEEGDMMNEQPEMLSISRDDLDAMVEAAANKAVAKALPGPAQSGAFLTKKNVRFNLNRPEDQPHTLARHIKAVRDKDWQYLRSRQGAVRASYKALGINPDTAGGYLVAAEQSTQIIEQLQSKAVVLPLCTQMPMNSDTLDIPSLTGGATVYMVGENAQITSADPTFGQKKLVAKKMAAMLKVSNELLNDSDPSVDALLRDDIARKMASKTDQQILLGTGVGNELLGIRYSSATKTALNAALTFANLNDTVYRVEVENVAGDPTWAWVFHPREKKSLRELEDTTGNLIWIGSQAPGNIGQSNPPTLLEYPVYTTTEISINAADNNETTAYYGQWNDVVVGMRKVLEIFASNEAGDAFEYDQTWIRAILRLDVVLRHDESIEVLTDIRDA